MNNSEQIKRIYKIEKKLALKLRSADSEARKDLYANVYNEYFDTLDKENLQVELTGDNRTGTTVNKDSYLKLIMARKSRILEIGCGSGETLRYLADQSKQLTGIDVSANVIKNSGSAINFVQGSALNIDLTPGFFDAAFSVDCIEHLHYDDMATHLLSVKNVLRISGMYLVMTPHRFIGPHDISMYFDSSPQGFHLMEYTYKDLASVFKNCGFTKICTSLLPYVMYNKFKFLKPFSTVPYAYKVWLENILKVIPSIKLRKQIFKCTGIYTVCISGIKEKN